MFIDTKVFNQALRLEAIGFANWLTDNCIYEEDNCYDYKGYTYTIEYLYDIYLKTL